jgi:ribonuclease P/MRP protein subunit RPP40
VARGLPECQLPISLFQCLGKLLERIMYAQFAPFIFDNELLCNKQHGFISGRSMLTNLLNCNATIAKIVSQHHPYDILSFDFAKAFDKAPHKLVISSLAQHGIEGKALDWLVSFLTGRTFRVRVGECYSRAADVSSGVIQGSILGPILYLFIDSLLRKLKLPTLAFADDVKIIADVTAYSASVV